MFLSHDLLSSVSLLIYAAAIIQKASTKKREKLFPIRPCVRRVRARCGQTEAATEQLIAAPAWPFYGTRPPLRNLCDLRTVRAAGSGFRGRHRALCADRGILGRLFGLKDAARPRTWLYGFVHGIRDKVHITNSWQSSRTCPMCSIVAQCIW